MDGGGSHGFHGYSLLDVIRRDEKVHDKGSTEAQETMLEFNKYKNKNGTLESDTS